MMHCLRFFVLVVAALLGAASAPASAAPASAPRSTPVDDADATAFAVDGEDAGAVAFARVDADAEGFSRAVSVAVPAASADPWGVQLHHTPTEAIAEGDALLATFTLRCTESMTGEGQVQFDFEQNDEPYDKSVTQVVYAPTEWKTFQIPFEAAQDFPAGTAQAAFQLGFRRQTIEFGGFRLENFGRGVAVADLPRTKQTYPGMEADAPWRADAAERIDRLRRGDLTVTVLDAAGEPVEGAEVHVEMVRHAFPFGTAVTSQLLTRTDATGQRYRAILARHFNEAVFENDLKWNLNNRAAPEAISASLDWLEAHGFTTRGHVLIWPNWLHTPDFVEAAQDDPPALRSLIEERIATTAGAWSGRLADWDVVNETHTNHDLQDVLGEDSVAEWFRLAKEADPAARLYINDYGILTAGATDSPHQQGYFDQITRLIEAGAPVEGIGLQGHFAARLTGPERLLEIVDRFASFGLPIKVTEFDIKSNDPQVQAAFLRDFYTAMFSHEAVDGILMWGFWSEAHWRPEAALFNADFSPRPHGEAYERLVLHDWWTDEAATTDDAGEATVRGFLGEHAVTVTAAGQTREATATLDRGGSSVTVRLP